MREGRSDFWERNGDLATLHDMRNTVARTFQDLDVWQRAHSFVMAIYQLTAAFPKTETYGLAAQARRAAVSIPANIAEGFGKRGRLDKARYLNIAQGSLEESLYYLILARDLDYCDPRPALDRLAETSRLFDAYRNAILRSADES
jgi:four helix bundle protein